MVASSVDQASLVAQAVDDIKEGWEQFQRDAKLFMVGQRRFEVVTGLVLICIGLYMGIHVEILVSAVSTSRAFLDSVCIMTSTLAFSFGIILLIHPILPMQLRDVSPPGTFTKPLLDGLIAPALWRFDGSSLIVALLHLPVSEPLDDLKWVTGRLACAPRAAWAGRRVLAEYLVKELVAKQKKESIWW